MTYRLLFATMAAVTTIGCGTGSQAASASDVGRGSDVVSVRVTLADLDLDSRTGAAVGLRRIRRAAGDICGPAPFRTDLAMQSPYRACLATAVDNAVDRLGNPAGSALNGGQPRLVRLASGR